MSNFKYSDDDFIRELMKIDNLLHKKAQTAPAAPPAQPPANPFIEPEKVSALAKKLMTNLLQSSSISQDNLASGDAEPYVKDLKDLPSLVEFLAVNRITSRGQNIIVGGPTNPDPKQYAEFSLITAGGAQQKVWANKQGLITYLTSLQHQAASEPNEILAAMVGRLIDNGNKQLKLGMNKNLPAAEHKGQFADSTPLDSLVEAMIYDNPLVPTRDGGTINVTPRDLKTKPGFDDFAKKIKIKKKDKVTTYEEFTDETFCDLIYVLWTRANSYNYRRGEAVDKYYLDLVTALAGQYQCNIQDSAAKAKGKDQNVSYRTQNGGLSGEAMSALATSLPLDPEEMDLNRIDAFTRAYAKYTQDNQRAQIAIQEVAAIKARYNGMTLQNLTRYSLKDVSEAIHRNTGGRETSPAPYFESLKQVLMATENMLSVLSSMNKNSAGAGPVDQFRADIAEQMTFFSKNLASINRWQQDMMAEYNNLNQRNK